MDFKVREIQQHELQNICDYFLSGDDAFLKGMGVDVSKLPARDEWLALLNDEFKKPIDQKKFFYVVWIIDGIVVGHSNINKIIFGEEAYMHLHLWKPNVRKKGSGRELVKKSLPFFFEKFRLKKLFCEPYALNPAPNRVLKEVGFEFIETYDTTPGWINFHQTVNRWCMDAEKFKRFVG